MANFDAIKQQLIEKYLIARHQTVKLCEPLAIEDYVIQSIEDVSPPKWHLAHTTWFYETFILLKEIPGYQPFHPLFHYLFNSYYHRIGTPYPRARRGMLARPTVATIHSYRNYIDEKITALIHEASENNFLELEKLIILGIHHEQQHQELLLMDIKHNFSCDPDFPSYSSAVLQNKSRLLKPINFIVIDDNNTEIGYNGNDFCFDNELPRHQQLLKSYSIANRLVTNGEYLEFILAGGYTQPDWWLADGWDTVIKNQWQAPLYWQQLYNNWYLFTLNGLQELDPTEPVAHVSYYEADAYARWCGCRLPTEIEWEHCITAHAIFPQQGNFLESYNFHPKIYHQDDNHFSQLFGDVWEWTASAYGPYPGYKSPSGALGEYNGKFMSNQFVLRGGSCVTPRAHIRTSYRNFFQPDKRWQFSGIRLANDI